MLPVATRNSRPGRGAAALLGLALLAAARAKTDCTKFDECYDCLDNEGDCFWCLMDNACHPIAELDSCPAHEAHDLIMEATGCCAPYGESFSVCLDDDRPSQCVYCPKFSLTGEPACFYKKHADVITEYCAAYPEVDAECSKYTDCQACLETNGYCGWCGGKTTCMPNGQNVPEPQEEYRCAEDYATTCCSQHSTCVDCSSHSGPINAQQCDWCPTTETCMGNDEARANCPLYIRFGTEYCDDECYVGAGTCEDCVKRSGCVWIKDFEFVEGRSASLAEGASPVPRIIPENVSSFCTAGSLSGPKSERIVYKTDINTYYVFKTHAFNYATCVFTGSQLVDLIIGLVCGLAGVLLVIWLAIVLSRKFKYAKIIKAAEAARAAEEAGLLGDDAAGAGEDAGEDNEVFAAADLVLNAQSVPWEDDE